MDLVAVSRTYLFVFYLLGQSCFNPRHTTYGRARKTIRKTRIHIPNCILTVIVMAITLSGLIFQNQSMKNFNFMGLVFSNFFLVLICVTNFVIIFQNTWHATNIKRVFTKFLMIEQIFLIHLHEKLSFVEFAKRFRNKICVCLSFFMLSFVVMMTIYQARQRGLFMTLHLFVVLLLALMGLLHALFYIDMEQYLIECLVRNLETAANARVTRILFGKTEHSAAIITLLGHYKHVHYKCWDISQMLGRHFAWILMLICLQNFIDVASSSYWIYRYVQEPLDGMILSNYNC